MSKIFSKNITVKHNYYRVVIGCDAGSRVAPFRGFEILAAGGAQL